MVYHAVALTKTINIIQAGTVHTFTRKVRSTGWALHPFMTLCILDIFFYRVFGGLSPFCAVP